MIHWRSNYHPAPNQPLRGWVAVHWQGLRKPWGALPTFDQRTMRKQHTSAHQPVNPAMMAAWILERDRLRERCPLASSSLHKHT